ncbi:MAG: hypothetical protein ACU0CT_03545 [Paracoccaceae bacterium]
MSDIVDLSPNRPLDRDGITVPGALAYFYLSGTTTPQEVYTTAAGDVAHPIPLEADAEGVFPPIFSAVALKCTVTDASGNVLPGYPVDPVAIITTGSGAVQISFEPTADIPETNVQSAIERVQLNLVAPLLAGGIGVTGNADTLANIDATTTASGAYRFTTGATGTFPSGVTAADGGTIRIWRETAAEAVMELSQRGSSATWQRTLAGSVWGAWALAGAGFTPVEQGGGSGMSAGNKVRFGWNGADALLAQVDSTALGVVHTSNLSAGAIGTYTLARRMTASDLAFGATVAGSDLRPISALYRMNVASSGNNEFSTGAALSGTWRCMGALDTVQVIGGISEMYGATLFMRIA